MAKKRLKLNSVELNAQKVSKTKLESIKGGYKNFPVGADSFGLINWSEIDIRSSNPIAETAPQILGLPERIMIQ